MTKNVWFKSQEFFYLERCIFTSRVSRRGNVFGSVSGFAKTFWPSVILSDEAGVLRQTFWVFVSHFTPKIAGKYDYFAGHFVWRPRSSSSDIFKIHQTCLTWATDFAKPGVCVCLCVCLGVCVPPQWHYGIRKYIHGQCTVDFSTLFQAPPLYILYLLYDTDKWFRSLAISNLHWAMLCSRYRKHKNIFPIIYNILWRARLTLP